MSALLVPSQCFRLEGLGLSQQNRVLHTATAFSSRSGIVPNSASRASSGVLNVVDVARRVKKAKGLFQGRRSSLLTQSGSIFPLICGYLCCIPRASALNPVLSHSCHLGSLVRPICSTRLYKCPPVSDSNQWTPRDDIPAVPCHMSTERNDRTQSDPAGTPDVRFISELWWNAGA